MTSANLAAFDRLVDEILNEMWQFYPDMASRSGLHEFDGRLPDISAASLAKRAESVKSAITRLDALDESDLSSQQRSDWRLLRSSLRKELFELTELRLPHTNPMDMQWHIEPSNYIKRDYAPLSQRIESLTSVLASVPNLVAQIADNLDDVLSAAILDASIESYEGLVSFYEKDLPQAAAPLGDDALKSRFDDALPQATQSLKGFVSRLKSLKERASDKFAIGDEKFLAMLLHGEMVDVSLDRLLEVGLADLERNKTRFETIAGQLEPSKTPSEVMKGIASLHPTEDSLIPETRGMLERIRAFLIDNDIITIPSDVRCAVTETPTYMRWATAALDMPGPFEPKATEAFYYVTPTEPNWTAQEKEEWLSNMNYAVLEITSIHEAYPGHYVHYLHTKSAPSKVSLAFGAYSFWEGWAHYVEQMMVEEGYAGGNPRLVLGQLSDALLRNCRYVCAIRMHTEGMTVAEATRFFMENGYMEQLPARKEAQRGTFDPMYLNYTLGKLMILKLREDYKKEQGAAYSLKKFHDAFLSFGAPPIPLVRQMMLRNPGDSVL